MTASSPNTPDLRKAITGGFIAILVLVGLLLGTGAFYTVDAAQQAVVLQFGRPACDPVTSPGLHFKMPFIQEVRFFDRRIQAWDGDPNQIPTRGREFISVDTTARWRIVDALKFLQSVRDERGALSRLDDILDSVVRDMVSSTDLVEIVRSSDWKVTTADLERAVLIEENVSELTRPIELGRQQLEEKILAEARKAMPQYGIELVDLRIKRLNYIESVQQQVFDRMISERQRVAEQFRSEGQGEASRGSALASRAWSPASISTCRRGSRWSSFSVIRPRWRRAGRSALPKERARPASCLPSSESGCSTQTSPCRPRPPSASMIGAIRSLGSMPAMSASRRSFWRAKISVDQGRALASAAPSSTPRNST